MTSRLIQAERRVHGGDRYAIAVSRWNDLVTGRLAHAAAETLRRHGAKEDQVVTVEVSGSFELPIVAERLAASGQYAAVIALGAVIQGETDHDRYINSAVAGGLMQAGQKHGIPVLFGVLTCRDMDQALNRAGGKSGNKGEEAALAAIDTVSVLRQIK